jgi:hypothetical protein
MKANENKIAFIWGERGAYGTENPVTPLTGGLRPYAWPSCCTADMPLPQRPTSKRNRIDETSPDMKTELLARLKRVVPEAFSDGQLDLKRLAELAGDAVVEPERYGLTWPGKRDAIAMLQAPSRATLVSERDKSVNFDNARHAFIEGRTLRF